MSTEAESEIHPLKLTRMDDCAVWACFPHIHLENINTGQIFFRCFSKIHMMRQEHFEVGRLRESSDLLRRLRAGILHDADIRLLSSENSYLLGCCIVTPEDDF